MHDGSSSYYTDTALDNSDRSYNWLAYVVFFEGIHLLLTLMPSRIGSCNELGFSQASAPVGTPTLVSRVLTPSYDEARVAWVYVVLSAAPR